jgi:hypothetical protein
MGSRKRLKRKRESEKGAIKNNEKTAHELP